MTTQNAITALQSYLMTLSDSAKAEFAQKNNINLSKINVMNLKDAESLCKALNLKYESGSVWDVYNKGKEEYLEATERFNQAADIFSGYKNELTIAKSNYDAMLAQYQAQKGDDSKLTSSERTSIANKTGYTTKLIKSTSDAELEMNLELASREAAVNTQWRGLYQGVVGEFLGLA